jgi:hypothetical protein
LPPKTQKYLLFFFLKKKKNHKIRSPTHLYDFVIFCLIIKNNQ